MNTLLGLLHCHNKGIMHRDIKPQNILLKDKRNIYDVKIIDFGLSTLVDEKNKLYLRCGTPGFVAPEIMRENIPKNYNEKCDVFSVGVLFYILLCGQTPFPSSNLKKVIALNKSCKINFLHHQFKNYSDDCMDLLQKMLLKDPEERISTSEALSHKYFLESGNQFFDDIPAELLKLYQNKFESQELEGLEEGSQLALILETRGKKDYIPKRLLSL